MANDRLDVVIFGASGFSEYADDECLKTNIECRLPQLRFIYFFCFVRDSMRIFIAGKYTVLEGVKILDGLNWGVAGRNEEKLKATLKEIGDKIEKDLSNTPIIVADVLDENSLKRMAERAKVNEYECYIWIPVKI